MSKKQPKPKKPFMSGYKKYDPSKEGYGDPSQWRAAFSARMGLGEAKAVLKDRNPWVVLGLDNSATWAEVQSAYRKLVLQYHPDRNFDADATEKFKDVQAAYEVLEDRFAERK